MSSAPKRTSPRSGRSSPEICLMKVVLPAPFGPITAWVSPSRTSKSTPSVASSAPKDLRSLRVSRSRLAMFPRQQTREPAPRKQHHEDQDHAQIQLPVLVHPLGQHAPSLQQVLQQQQRPGTEQRPG